MIPEGEHVTSEQAAALWLSDGQTDDPQKAVNYDVGQELDMDGLQRSHLRRMMGFDFGIQIHPNVILVTATDGSLLRTRCKLLKDDTLSTKQGLKLTNEAAIDRLVDACERLKVKWEAKHVR